MSLQTAKIEVPKASTLTPSSPVRRRWGAPLNAPIQDWRGQRVWLVGASSGIGLACAKALHAAGAQVIVSARDLGTLSEWAATCKSQGLPVELLSLDVTDALQVKYVARQVAAGGKLDFLLYCAGHYRAQRATDFDLTDMLRHQDVNYNGLLRVLDAVLPMFLQQGSGHISVVSSVAGLAWLAQWPGLWPDQGRCDTCSRNFVHGLARQGHWRERGQPRLCGNALDGTKQLSNARAPVTRASRGGHVGGVVTRFV